MTGELLAKILGLSFFILSLGLLINRKALKALVGLFRSREFLIMTGSFFTICGLVIISLHNIWEFSWRGVVTAVGWVLLLEGLFRIFFMDLTIKMIKEMRSLTPVKISLIFTLVVGIYLTLISFL